MGHQPLYLSFTFKVKNENLTGSCLAGSSRCAKGKKYSLEDGKIDGHNISFRVAMKWDGMDVTHYYTGTLLGNALRLTYTTDMSEGSDAVASTVFVRERRGQTLPPPVAGSVSPPGDNYSGQPDPRSPGYEPARQQQ